jgi:murein DD-endopeptidase MepM/ murein hydrolase activator NlpD
MGKGRILNRCKDFLGQSLVISHEGGDPSCPKVVLVYSHLEIKKNLTPGCWVEKGQIIGRVFDTAQKRSKLLPHLHFSCIELMEKTLLEDLNWDLFSNREKINLINPVFI